MAKLLDNLLEQTFASPNSKVLYIKIQLVSYYQPNLELLVCYTKCYYKDFNTSASIYERESIGIFPVILSTKGIKEEIIKIKKNSNSKSNLIDNY